MSVRIVTDSASDMTLQELENMRVELVPVPLLCGGETLLDDKTRPMADFWRMMDEGIRIKTSQPSPESFLSVFEDAKRAGDAVVCIVLSPRLSGTWQGACLAKEMAGYDLIYIVDPGSAAAAAAEKLLVYRACKLRDAGKDAAEIADDLTRYRERVRLIACLDTLDYLARGGRLPQSVAGIGKLMHIKPIITLTAQGNIEVIRKEIGAPHAMREMVALVKAHRISKAEPIIPIYARTGDNCEHYLQKLRQAGVDLPMRPMEPIGATIGVYIGPGGYGLVFAEDEP